MANLFNRHINLKKLILKLMVLVVIPSVQILVPQELFAATNRKKLLVIDSYNEGASWVQPYITSFLRESAYRPDLNCDIVYLNSTLIRDTTFYNRVVDGVFDRFTEDHPDYLVIIGKSAFSLRDRIKAEWGDIPMLYMARNDWVGEDEKYLSGDFEFLKNDKISLSDIRQDYNFTFVEIPDLYQETVDMMVMMQPQMKKLVFVSDELVTNIELNKQINEYVSEKYPELEYEWLTSSEETRHAMQHYLISEDLQIGLLFSSCYYSRTSAMGFPILVAGDYRLVSSSPHPIFSLKESFLHEGAVGGCYVDSDDIIKWCKNVLNKMEQNSDMSVIPFYYPDRSAKKVDYGRLKLNNLDINNCPEDVEFINRPLSLWELYAQQFILLCVIILATLTVLIFFLFYQHKKIVLMRLHNNLINNMPVTYMVGRVKTDIAGKVVGLDFISGNDQERKMFADNTDDSAPRIFNVNRLVGLIETLRAEKHDISYIHHFEKTDVYYQYLLCSTTKPDEVEIFGLDITEEKRKAQALAESSKSLEMTLAVANIIPWKWNLTTHRITFKPNKFFEQKNIPMQWNLNDGTRVFSEDEFFNRVCPDDLNKLKTMFNELTNGSQKYVKDEFRVISESRPGEMEWIEINASVLNYGESGHPEELMGSLMFVTDRKNQEIKYIEACNAAKESDRLKSAFLANMSHEIRTPLNAIVGFSEQLATVEDKELKQKYINLIDSNAQLLTQLIGDILDLSKIEANTLEFEYRTVNLNELMLEIDETVKSRVQPGVALNHNLGAAECHIHSEPTRLRQVLINLLTNACKFTPKGSITFGYELRDNEIYFYVKDTGHGISKEAQEQIFKRFAKLNNFVQGTGLGLSICKSIVEKMDGHIGMESSGVGMGTLFWFTLPLNSVEVKTEIKVNKEPKQVMPSDKITLLVAEDNESNYLLFEAILSSTYNLIHAWNGIEAVELFKQHNPPVIIMDINMPQMDGYEATREIRKVSSAVQIIAVTAYAFVSDKERIMESGFNGYVSKPVNTKRLNEELKNAINNYYALS